MPTLLGLCTLAQGKDEVRFDWYCTQTGDGVLVVPCINGSGDYTLSYTISGDGDSAPIPEYLWIVLLCGTLGIVIASVLFIHLKYRKADAPLKSGSSQKAGAKGPLSKSYKKGRGQAEPPPKKASKKKWTVGKKPD